MAKEKGLTPMMKQYLDVRATLPANTLLLFRLGDFYEMFDADAEQGSQLLGITLTARGNQKMAGIPYHSAENYINKALDAGVKVAICEQVETAQAGKLVKRELTRILTPGTTIESSQIAENQNHYLLSFSRHKNGYVAAWLDLTSGDFQITQTQSSADLFSLFAALQAKEVILTESEHQYWQHLTPQDPLHAHWSTFALTQSFSELPDFYGELSFGAESVKKTLGVLNLEGFGVDSQHPALSVAGILLHYATETLRAAPQNIASIYQYHCQQHLRLDPATSRSLEIFQSSQNSRSGSLIDAMDQTITAAGSRLLESYLISPPTDIAEIQRRQNTVGALYQNANQLEALQTLLKEIRDIKRILGRLQNRLRNPRELGGIRHTLNQIPNIKEWLSQYDQPELQAINQRLATLPQLQERLNQALNDELPSKLQDGGIIREGFDQELDDILKLSKDNRSWLLELEKNEQEATGIKNLKVKYNGSFGYFIEVSKGNISLVPDHYIRKQTMTNAERYYTPALKEKEKDILSAAERSIAREEVLFQGLVQDILSETHTLNETAKALAELDLLTGWARIAQSWNYCCPQFTSDGGLHIEQGRHPVVEQKIKQEEHGIAGAHAFVPNDTELHSANTQIGLITGPNMAGKSTYIRQVALIALMAHAGSWVPAQSCELSPMDRIFSRVGASDELAKGNSTFMVEMNETANILNNASVDSLIILDEIGRGTSTYDGLSIAWAVVEHLHGNAEQGPKTLFATHYHELPQLAQAYPRIQNYCVAVKEWNEQIIFVRQVIPGAADKSYGIQVARLAGLPDSVVKRAQEILHTLENKGDTTSPPPASAVTESTPVQRLSKKARDNSAQLNLF